MRIYLLLAMAAGASFIGSNCGGSGVGDPCVPEDEYLTDFTGYSVGEVNVESRSFQCLTRVCLVNHFRGRVSCPYGETEDVVGTCESEPAKCAPGGELHESSCRIPGRDGSAEEDRVVVPVDPQFQERQAEDTVYCSCRCAPPPDAAADNAKYCECPSGFACEQLVDDLDLGKGQLAGGYCVKDGTSYDRVDEPIVDCSFAGADCGSVVERFSPDRGAFIEVGRNPGNTCEMLNTVCDDDTKCCGTMTCKSQTAGGETKQTCQ